MKIKEIYYHFR